MSFSKNSLFLHGLIGVCKESIAEAPARAARAGRRALSWALSLARPAARVAPLWLALSALAFFLCARSNALTAENFYLIPVSELPAPGSSRAQALDLKQTRGLNAQQLAAMGSLPLTPKAMREFPSSFSAPGEEAEHLRLSIAVLASATSPVPFDLWSAARELASRQSPWLSGLALPPSDPVAKALKEPFFKDEVASAIALVAYVSLLCGALLFGPLALLKAAFSGAARWGAKTRLALEAKGEIGAAERLARSERRALAAAAKPGQKATSSKSSL